MAVDEHDDTLLAETADERADAPESTRADRMDEDDRLKPEYVARVRRALADEDEAEAYSLVEPLHPADVADLFELLQPDERRELASAITDLMTGEVIAELNRSEERRVGKECRL